MAQPNPVTSASNKGFGLIQWNRLEPTGAAACNQIIASGFGAAEIKSGFWRFPTIFFAPPLRSASLARVEAALARRSDHSACPAQRHPRLRAAF